MVPVYIRTTGLTPFPFFSQIRKKAISSLGMHVSSQKAAKTILLAKKCHVASWLRAAYIRLVEEPSLSLSEVQELDFQTQINIYYIRDEVKCRAGRDKEGMPSLRHYASSWINLSTRCSRVGERVI